MHLEYLGACEDTGMAEEAQSSKKGQRKSYTREEKLRVVSFYKENNSNLYRTCQQLTVLRWVRREEEIKQVQKRCHIGSPYNKPAMLFVI